MANKKLVEIPEDVNVVRTETAPTTASRGGCYSTTKTTTSTGKVETKEYSYRGEELARYEGCPRDISAEAEPSPAA
jgi:hypothetical protein